ncbi:MAG TPA: FAD:protein FMN transferase [Rhodanobacteraceae bacterium]|nr:FAD:protein FMN transferase [Rhodanobacteraceae bacterium]
MRTRWAVLLLFVLGCATASAQPLRTLHGETMGTRWTVKFSAPVVLADGSVQRAIQTALDRVDGAMSTYKPDSALSRFNRAPAASWQTLPADLFTVLQRALVLAKESAGAYDPTVGPLVDLWGFGPERHAHQPPTQAAIDAARRRVGWWQIRLDPATRRAFQPGGVRVDLSSIAKGFGVDQVARALATLGIHDYLIEVGGELRAAGSKPDGGAWRVAIERPSIAAGDAGPARSLALRNRAIATSGDYRRFFMDGDVVYSHHIDPRTGWPVPYQIASVSVVAPSTIEADPIGTLISVLGPDAGMAYATRHHLAVHIYVHDGQRLDERMSPAFADLLSP